MFNFLKRIAASIQNPAADRKILFLDDADDKLKIKDSNGDLETLTLGGGSATEDAIINGLTVGKGAGNIATNTAAGSNALLNNTTGPDNVAVGADALYSNTDTGYHTAIGYQALYSNIVGWNSTAVGRHALYSNTNGSANVAVGHRALYSNTTANFNTAVGVQALYLNTTGTLNAAFGFNALYANTTGNNNTAIGRGAMELNTTGSNNSANGIYALFTNTTGSNNVADGYQAGRYITGGGSNQTSNNSLYLGYDTRASADGNTNEIVIGHTAIGLGSNTAVLGNASIVTTALRGSVGVNTTSPNASAQLQIDSTTKGFLPPRMTAAQATAIASPAEGLLVYVTDTDGTFTTKGWWGYDGAAWKKLDN